MSLTPTLPPNDKGMWRKVIARCHPDVGGSHDLFIWSMATRDVVCGGELGEEIPRRPHRDPDRVPFDQFAVFEVLTDRAVTMVDAVAEPPFLRTISLMSVEIQAIPRTMKANA
jgi:hypothetical protein